ncbi:type II secretion system protein [Vibrio sp. 10N.222.54.F12]|uniref:type II secretion system protein n=1 Tax=Vibrio TaxID=662 RepID=UPI0002D28773|nr:prepilin-type N-terminal cleavage/methylation domain-containing protein [Vibrio tasmaniensis]OEF68611.1 MSHA biogenesis protein MshA [Vibrio tasmaniensis 1F-187]PML12301.1 MSHA biogenesis protein MshA [Vibrio tasmaniensis]PML52653.1 MSHA biogenesis protein MshA [Vibrio tasmaniensis]
MKKQSGFTLIELVVVIVILGILAVTAAPRFLNLQGDARTSSMQGLRGAMAGATGIVYGRAAVDGREAQIKTGDAGTTPQTTDNIAINFGYPTATAIGVLPRGIETAVVGLPGTDWVVVNVTETGVVPDAVAYSFAGTDPLQANNGFVYDATTPANNNGCFVIYVEAANATTPAFVDVVTTGANGC